MTSADCRLDLYPHCEDECDSSWCALRGCSASSCHCVRKPASKAANDRPLGIADLIDAVSPGDVLKRYPGDLPRGMASLAHWPDWWYWCRRHVDAHKAGVRCKCTCITSGPDVDGPDIECPRHGIDSELPCVDVGPFMSEAEARRLAPVQIVLSPVRVTTRRDLRSVWCRSEDRTHSRRAAVGTTDPYDDRAGDVRTTRGRRRNGRA